MAEKYLATGTWPEATKMPVPVKTYTIVSITYKKTLAAWASPEPRWGSLQRTSRSPSWLENGWLPRFPRTSSPALACPRPLILEPLKLKSWLRSPAAKRILVHFGHTFTPFKCVNDEEVSAFISIKKMWELLETLRWAFHFSDVVQA